MKFGAAGRVDDGDTTLSATMTHNVIGEERWLYYKPTFFPSHEVKEWGGRWDTDRKVWRLPRLARMVVRIRAFDEKATIHPDVAKMLNPWDVPPERVEAILEKAGYEKTEMYELLFDYQRQAVAALVLRKFHGTLLTLSPGLGKTPTSIIAADIAVQKSDFVEAPRILVVAPLSLVNNWMREIEKWSVNGGSRSIARGRVETDTIWTVTNPDSLFERARATPDAPLRITGLIDPVWDEEWDIVIFDESVLYKNRKSKRTIVAKSLAHKADKVWLLSGAPITRDNSDAWAQFNIMEPDYFSSFWRFAGETCVVEQNQWATVVVGSRHGVSLRDEFPDMMFVRNQEEVFDDLPQVIFQDLELPLTRRQKKAHDDLMDVWIHELETNADSRVEVTQVIAQLIRLQQVTSNLKNLETTGKSWPDESSKADAVMGLIEAQSIAGPVLIWTQHRPGAVALRDRIEKALTKAAKKGEDHKTAPKKQRVELVYGGTKGADKIIEDFKAGGVDYLIMSIGVGKYGHTLANVRTVIYYDRTWDSDAMFQSLHRYAGARGKLAGYDHNPVVIILRCRGTVDDFVEQNLAGKLPSMASTTGANLAKILRSLGADMLEAV